MKPGREAARGLRLLPALVAAFWLAPIAGRTQGPERNGAASEIGRLAAEMARTVEAIEANRRAQAEAWPRREEDLALELPPPPAVLELQEKERALIAEKRSLRWKLEWALERLPQGEACDAAGPVFHVLEEAQSPVLVEVLVPVLVKACGDEARARRALERIAARFEPCPLSAAKALARMGGGAGILFELGLARGELPLLRQALASGDPDVLARAIEAARAGGSRGDAAFRALFAFEPPRSPEAARRAEDTLLDGIREAQAPKLRASLVTLLGLFRNPERFRYLESLARGAEHEIERLAAIGALGNLGERSAPALLDIAGNEEEPARVRRAAVHALGAARALAAAGRLIELSAEPGLRDAALRALRRIAGRDFGSRRGAWIRWWRARPESGYVDPEAG